MPAQKAVSRRRSVSDSGGQGVASAGQAQLPQPARPASCTTRSPPCQRTCARRILVAARTRLAQLWVGGHAGRGVDAPVPVRHLALAALHNLGAVVRGGGARLLLVACAGGGGARVARPVSAVHLPGTWQQPYKRATSAAGTAAAVAAAALAFCGCRSGRSCGSGGGGGAAHLQVSAGTRCCWLRRRRSGSSRRRRAGSPARCWCHWHMCQVSCRQGGRAGRSGR